MCDLFIACNAVGEGDALACLLFDVVLESVTRKSHTQTDGNILKLCSSTDILRNILPLLTDLKMCGIRVTCEESHKVTKNGRPTQEKY